MKKFLLFFLLLIGDSALGMSRGIASIGRTYNWLNRPFERLIGKRGFSEAPVLEQQKLLPVNESQFEKILIEQRERIRKSQVERKAKYHNKICVPVLLRAAGALAVIGVSGIPLFHSLYHNPYPSYKSFKSEESLRGITNSR